MMSTYSGPNQVSVTGSSENQWCVGLSSFPVDAYAPKKQQYKHRTVKTGYFYEPQNQFFSYPNNP